MADVAIAILQLVAEIRDEAKGIERREWKANRLVNRVTAIEPALIAVKFGEIIRPPPERLRQLSEAVERIKIFFNVYARSPKLQRALIWKDERFKDLSVAIHDAVMTLQLDLLDVMKVQVCSEDGEEDLVGSTNRC